MQIEIREMLIRAKVRQREKEQRSNSRLSPSEREALIRECLDRILAELQDRQSR
jgi:hypothetical protein